MFNIKMVAATSTSIVTMAMLCTWAFPAIALPQMALPGSPINFTTEQATWFASLPFLMNIPGSLSAGPLCEWLGPRRLMLIFTPVLCGATALMAAASWQVVQQAVATELLLLTTRVLQGGAQAVLLPTVVVYIYELCDARRRGTMISVQEIWGTVSYPLCYLVGCLLEWPVVACLISLVTFVPAIIGLLVSPESPAWMLKKGREREALQTLTQLRSSQDEISEEVKAIKEISQTDTSLLQPLQLLRRKSNILAIILVSVMIALKEMNGCIVLSVFIVQIFKNSGAGFDPCLSSVIAGFTRVVFRGVASISIHYSRRKPLLLVGTFFTATGTASLGAFFLLQSSGADVSWLGWLPLLSVIVFMIGYDGIVGSGTWTVAMEVLPGTIRSLGFTFGTAVYAAVSFTLSKTFENGEPAITLHGVFWLYTAGSIAYGIFITFFVIETRGRTLQDIEKYWKSFDT